MNLPSVLHPTVFNIGGYHIRVMTYFPVTDRQAQLIAMHGFRMRKWTKKDLKKLHTQMWTGDQESLALLG
jgi:hypothetical protein